MRTARNRDQTEDEQQRVQSFYRKTSLFMTAGAAASIVVALASGPSGGYDQTPEFQERRRDLAESHRAACNALHPVNAYDARSCANDRAERQARNEAHGTTGGIALLFSVFFTMQAAGLHIGYRTASRELQRMRGQKPPEPGQ